LLAISAQLRTRLSATRLIGLVPAVTGLRACDRDPNAGKTVRERGEPQTATSSFNTRIEIALEDMQRVLANFHMHSVQFLKYIQPCGKARFLPSEKK
jgi:hypothetical protein